LNKTITEFRDSEIVEFISIANIFENLFVENESSYIRFGDKRLNKAYLKENKRLKEIRFLIGALASITLDIDLCMS
jgi:hypothetical protein